MTTEFILERLTGNTIKEEEESIVFDKFDYNTPPVDIDFNLKVKVQEKWYNVGGPGMLGLITGPEKSRKTTLLSAVVASAIANGKQFINFSFNLPTNKRILFIDAEQPPFYFYQTQKRIADMACLFTTPENCDAYNFRRYSAEQRLEYTEQIISERDDWGLIIMDGALKLVNNMNNETECDQLTQRLMRWTAETGAMVITVVHQSKGTGFMIGHLGAYLGRACDFGIDLQKNKDDGFTRVSSRATRTVDFPPFEFTQDENGYPILDYNQKIDLSPNVSWSQFPVENDYPDDWG